MIQLFTLICALAGSVISLLSNKNEVGGFVKYTALGI